ncbi:hypothetical protein DHEL01_v201272 [Diaporthe helianthi]|uniref:Uncharacterized protein n=1 Tax=Diaporthe helianthi TaxID=158607 RepID=A0A2P5ICZ7_DIAHE|nr:hypothetical protein DHEL01_v201272 [Diaporthe helianthi]
MRADPKDGSAHDVVPANKGYRHFFFAFTPECMRHEDVRPCQDNQFGVTNLSGKPGFVPNNRIGDFNLSKQIVKCVGSVVSEYDASNYMQINYEAPNIQAAVMQANMPLARFIIYCPPCVSAITTAVHLCQVNEDAITECHRLGCACCPNMASGLARLSMIADTIVDVGTGHHRAKPNTPEVYWMKSIDRAWLENVLYNADDQSPASTPTSNTDTTTAGNDYAAIRDLLTFEGKVRESTVAVILGDVDNASWIINAAPFPTVKRQPRTGEMFHIKHNYMDKSYNRSFLGTFEAKGALKRRKGTSPPPETTKSKAKRKVLVDRKGNLAKTAVGDDELH